MFQFFAAMYNGNVGISKIQTTFKTYLPALSLAQTEKSKTEREREKQQSLSMR